MKFAPKKLTSSFAFSIFWLLFLGLGWYLSLPAKPFVGDVRSILVGEWKIPNKMDCLFRTDGTWERVFPPPNTGNAFTVFKGRYTVSGSSFTMSGHKRFYREQRADKGKDAPFVLDRSDHDLGDIDQWEIYNLDKGTFPEY